MPKTRKQLEREVTAAVVAADAPALDLSSVRVLWRDRNGGLWGIPYDMRPGQSPHHIREDLRRGWIYLGTHFARRGDLVTGWWGSTSRANQAAIAAFLARQASADSIPDGFPEWSRVED